MTLAVANTVRWLGGALAALALAVAPARAQDEGELPTRPADLRGLDIVEKPGSQVPLDLELIDSTGEAVKLASRFRGRPVVLSLVYYDCPIACQAIMTKMAHAFGKLDYAIGEQYDVVTVSFDPTNTPEMAAAKKAEILLEYGRENPSLEGAWSFFVTNDRNARAIADSVGFIYRYVKGTGEYAHPSGIFVLTPDGKVSRCFYGFDYPPTQLKLALLEASNGEIARSWGDKLLLWCYHFDPKRGSYSLAAFRVMQLGALVTMVLLAGLIAGLRLAEGAKKRRARRRAAAATHLPVLPVPLAGAGQH